MNNFIRAILPMLYRQRGRYPDLEAHLEKMPVEAQRDLLRLLRNTEDDLHAAKRTWRPFPGGPKVRL